MTIPIVFAIDNNVVMPCGITITSLLMNAKPNTCYDIYILCNQLKLNVEGRKKLNDAFANHSQCRLSFVDVGENYKETEGLTTGHITTAAYYRLAIPVLFPQFEKMIYSDVDIIFQQDLSELYETSLLKGELLAAVLDLAIDDKYYFRSDLPSKIGKSVKDYFNSGFMVLNLKQMREENIVEKFNQHARIKYAQHDQDVLNVVCKGRVQILSLMYNFQLNHFSNYMWGRKTTDIQFGELFKHATLHYTWWHYYKMSPFYDDMVYFRRQYEQIEAWRNDYHQKTNSQLLKRIAANIKHKLFK